MQKKHEGQIRIQFNEEYDERLEYEDKLPEGVTKEEIKEKFGKVVWCEFHDCFWNNRVKDLQKTWGTIIGNKNYQPIGSNPTEAVFKGLCTRPDEIAIRFRKVRGHTGASIEVPYCYTAAKNGKTGHTDFSKLIQGDGTPFGGNIDSQHADLGGMSNIPSRVDLGRERIVKYGGAESASRPTKEYNVDA